MKFKLGISGKAGVEVNYDQKEYAEFRETLVRHLAALTNVAARYTAKLFAVDRDWFFEQALNRAWELRNDFSPCEQGLNIWFDRICKEVALSRTTWTVLTITGEKIVSGKHLHLWGLNCNGDFLDTI